MLSFLLCRGWGRDGVQSNIGSQGLPRRSRPGSTVGTEAQIDPRTLAQGHPATAELPGDPEPRCQRRARPPSLLPSPPSRGPHPDRVHEALHLGGVQDGRQRPDEHPQGHVVHGGDAARVDAAARRALAGPGSLGGSPVRPGPPQRSSGAQTHGDCGCGCWGHAWATRALTRPGRDHYARADGERPGPGRARLGTGPDPWHPGDPQTPRGPAPLGVSGGPARCPDLRWGWGHHLGRPASGRARAGGPG